MKIRNGFVSNSSSSSFVVSLIGLTDDQIEKIFKYYELYKVYADRAEFFEDYDINMYGWFIQIYENHIRGFTYMDDIDMREYLQKIGVDMRYASIEHGIHRTEPWINSIINDKTRELLKKHVGKYVAYNYDEIYAVADTYTELKKKISNAEYQYIVWVDPEFYD